MAELNDENLVEYECDPAVLWLPPETVEVQLEIKILQNGELVTAHRTLGVTEVRKAFQDAEDNYIDPDRTYTLTDKGRELMEQIRKEGAECLPR